MARRSDAASKGQMRLVVDLNKEEAAFLEAVGETGLYRQSCGEAALRLLDEAIEARLRGRRDGPAENDEVGERP